MDNKESSKRKEISNKIREINEVFKPKIQEIDKENILLKYYIEEKGNGYNMNQAYGIKYGTNIEKTIDIYHTHIKLEFERLTNYKK